jgi:membrane-bound lytic murein transglycosylase D
MTVKLKNIISPRIKYLILFIAFVSFDFYNSFSQQTSFDSTFVDSTIDIEDYSRNLDSMLTLWYVQSSINSPQNLQYNYPNDTAGLPHFTNEEYQEQLAHMNTYIEMTYNDVVQKFIEFYAIKRRRQVEVMLGLSEYYFPIFEEALDKYGLPLELKFLPIIESALNPRAISRAGASGLWQFMYTTGKLYKLNVNSFVDERQDPVKASDAAARYLRDLYDIFHDWHLVIAAYNCGPGNIYKAIKRTGKTTYWGIYDRLPRETRGYVPAFIAAAYAMTNYKEYKMVPRKIEMPVATDTIIITNELHLQQVAEVLQIPLEKLKSLNPQYKKNIIPANYEPYPLMLPAEYLTQFIALKDSIFNYKDSLFFGNVRPSQYGNPALNNNNNKTNSSGDVRIVYTIKSGDTFGTIAKRFQITTADIKSWNNIHKNRLVAGKKLDIYVSSDRANKYKNTNSNKTQTTKNNTTISNDGKWITYTIQSGDNFWSISKKYGVSVDDLYQWNSLNKSSKLQVGQKIKIKK